LDFEEILESWIPFLLFVAAAVFFPPSLSGKVDDVQYHFVATFIIHISLSGFLVWEFNKSFFLRKYYYLIFFFIECLTVGAFYLLMKNDIVNILPYFQQFRGYRSTELVYSPALTIFVFLCFGMIILGPAKAWNLIKIQLGILNFKNRRSVREELKRAKRKERVRNEHKKIRRKTI
jgi:hypothetical protein